MKQALSRLETEKGRKKGLEVQLNVDDVIICTPPKCGTTLICAVVHSLRSGGDTSYDEINLEIPCLEMAYDYGLRDLDNFQAAFPPRVFKTHSWRRDCPMVDGVKVIYTVRDPRDAGPSFYHFLGGWFFDPTEIDMDVFLNEFMLRRGAPSTNMENASQWHNMASWYPFRHDPNVLWLFYEDVVADLPRYVDVIADFLHLAGDDAAARAVAVQQGDINFMKLAENRSKYDEHMLKLARNEVCGLHPRAGLDGRSAGKVREGRVGDWAMVLSDATVAEMEKKWAEVMLPVAGYSNYDEFRSGVNRELGR